MQGRLIRAALGAAMLAGVMTGSAAAGSPEVTIIDVSDPAREASFEADLLLECGYAIDVEATGHIIVHVFDGDARLLQISNYRMFETFSANGKTIVVRPDSGPDVVWVGGDGDVYLAIVGRSVTGSGIIGRTVVNLSEFELVSISGLDVGNFLTNICEGLAP